LTGDDLQSSGEEDEDDFASMHLVEDAPGNVRASVSLTPDQDLPPDLVENHVITEDAIEPSDEMEPAEEVSAEYDEAGLAPDATQEKFTTIKSEQFLFSVVSVTK